MKYADRVKDTTTTTGTGNITLAGSAPTGFRTFAAAFSVGKSNIPYAIDDGAGNWEIGLGTLSGSTTFTRDVVLSSSTGAKINFGAGTKTLVCTLAASAFSRNTINPDDVGFDIVMYCGQSNAVGFGTINAAMEIVDPNVWQWGCKSSDSATYQQIIQYSDPAKFNDTSTGFSPAGWFAKAYLGQVPKNRKVLIIPLARSATGIIASPADWAYPSGSLYTNAIAQTNAALAAAQAIYPSSRVVGIVWQQGETDGDGTVTQSAYETALTNVLNGFRSGVTGASSAWIIIGGMVPEFISGSSARLGIDAAHQAVAAAMTNCVFVAGPAGKTGDNVHYSDSGVRIIGSRIGLAVTPAINDLTVAAATVPGAPNIGTATAGNAQATVSFTAPASNGGSAITGFTVTASPGGATATGSASPLTVTGLTNGTAYTFTATATNAIGTGPASSASNSVTPAVVTAPAQVTGLTLGIATSTTQPLTWTAPSNGGSAITDYVVQWSPAGANTWTTFADGTSTSASATVTGLTASTSYDYRVAAVNAIGTGSYSSTATGSTAAGASYTMFNTADAATSAWTFSNSNKTVTRTSDSDGSFRSVRGGSGKSTGKWYFEVTNTGFTAVGVAKSTSSLTTFVGNTADSWGVLMSYPGASPAKYHSGSDVVLSAISYASSYVVGVALDLDAGTLETFFNGVSAGVIYSGISGTLLPMVSSNTAGTSLAANFGASAFAYTPPSGFTGWTA